MKAKAEQQSDPGYRVIADTPLDRDNGDRRHLHRVASNEDVGHAIASNVIGSDAASLVVGFPPSAPTSIRLIQTFDAGVL